MEMFLYSWFADAHNWTPQQVRELSLEELNWLPIFKQAKTEVQLMKQQAEERRQQGGRQAIRGGS